MPSLDRSLLNRGVSVKEKFFLGMGGELMSDSSKRTCLSLKVLFGSG